MAIVLSGTETASNIITEMGKEWRDEEEHGLEST